MSSRVRVFLNWKEEAPESLSSRVRVFLNWKEDAPEPESSPVLNPGMSERFILEANPNFLMFSDSNRLRLLEVVLILLKKVLEGIWLGEAVRIKLPSFSINLSTSV